jgi:hypothetical protein
LFFYYLAVSFNQPQFCSDTSWNPNAINFTNHSINGSGIDGIFINTNNTVYVANYGNNQILIWLEGSSSPTTILSSGLFSPFNVFVTITGDIYVDNGYSHGRVDKWAFNATNSTPATYVSSACYGLFVGINNFIYCSMGAVHQIIMKSLNNSVNPSIIVAGTGCSGMTPNMLYKPSGIFVDTSLSVYVADAGNNRIQFFPAGQLNGTTIAGNGASGSISLNYPTAIILDGDGYLFIVDSNNNRIVGSGPNGFRCLVGCSEISGSASNQLKLPLSISFDSYGNIFVIDNGNNRIQKFLLATNSCGKYQSIRLLSRYKVSFSWIFYTILNTLKPFFLILN